MSKSTVNVTNGLPVIHDRASGIDIGSRFHVAAVPTALTDEPVQTFRPLQQIFSAWQLGYFHWVFKPLRWNRQAFIGCPYLKF